VTDRHIDTTSDNGIHRAGMPSRDKDLGEAYVTSYHLGNYQLASD